MQGGEHLYVMQMARTGAIKVGRSSDVKRRRAEIQTGCPYEVRIILIAKGLGRQERIIHDRMRRFRLRNQKGEWFSEMALGSLPDDIYDMMSMETVEMVNGDWWRNVNPDRGPFS